MLKKSTRITYIVAHPYLIYPSIYYNKVYIVYRMALAIVRFFHTSIISYYYNIVEHTAV